MGQKWKIVVTAVVLVAMIAAAGIAYNQLKLKTGLPDQLAVETRPESAPSKEAESKTETAKTDETAGTEEQTEPERLEAVDFTVYDGDGNGVTLSSLEGKPVVINFWATWCGYCVQEMPDFQKVYEEYGDQVHFMMINATDGVQETKELAMAHVEEKGYTFPVYYDLDMDASYQYGVASLPTTLLISGDGYVAAYGRGAIRYDTLKNAVEDVLAQEPVQE